MNASPALNAILGKTGLTDEQLRSAGVSVLGPPSPRSAGAVSESPQLLRAALDYARRGWPVIPLHSPTARGCSCGRADCQSVGKHPRTRNGSKDGSRDPAAIREWWRRWPDANVGIATGPESGILVLDVDGAQGEESLIDLAQRGHILPDTYTVRTGSGGQHLYFAWPKGADVRNSARKLAPGLDVRGAGGLVAAPPSLHKSGARYEVNESATDPAPCPEWLLSLIQGTNGAETRQSAPAAGAVEGERLIPKGKGDPAKLALAGSMFRTHQPFDVILAAVCALDKRCEHQRGEEECRRKVNEWAKRYSQGKPLAEEKCANVEADLICLANVPVRAVDWLWQPRIALGMINELIGDSGVGKTTIALNLAAGGSRGRLPEGGTCEPFSTIYMTCENPIAEVLAPKFLAMGGDPNRLYVLKGTRADVDGETVKGSISLSDTGTLRDAIRKTGAKLLVVDPLQSFFGANIDWNHANQTRPVMDGIGTLIDEERVAALFVRHGTKATGGKATAKGLGSADMTGAARSSLLAGVLPDDDKQWALIHFVTNIGPRAGALGYAIDDQGVFSWTGASSITAAQLLAAPESPDRKLAEAVQWLSEKLKAGSADKEEVCEQADAAGISYRTLQRAKSALRVQSRRATFAGGSIWSLPANETASEAVQ